MFVGKTVPYIVKGGGKFVKVDEKISRPERRKIIFGLYKSHFSTV